MGGGGGREGGGGGGEEFLGTLFEGGPKDDGWSEVSLGGGMRRPLPKGT